jgi:hypothetical protein
MENRDTRYTLEGLIEFDEDYFTVESSAIEQEKGIRVRGAIGKENVAIMAESTVLEDLDCGFKMGPYNHQQYKEKFVRKLP